MRHQPQSFPCALRPVLRPAGSRARLTWEPNCQHILASCELLSSHVTGLVTERGQRPEYCPPVKLLSHHVLGQLSCCFMVGFVFRFVTPCKICYWFRTPKKFLDRDPVIPQISNQSHTVHQQAMPILLRVKTKIPQQGSAENRILCVRAHTRTPWD